MTRSARTSDRTLKAREELDTNALVILVFFNLLGLHRLCRKDETSILDRNPAQSTEDFFTVFQRRIAAAQRYSAAADGWMRQRFGI